MENSLNLGKPDMFSQVMGAYNESKKKFLEEETERFHRAYQASKDVRFLKLYKRFLQERVKCRL